MTPPVYLVRVFSDGPNGGNPAPIVVDAEGLSDEDMRAVAKSYGHESGFVLPPRAQTDCAHSIRFWVPNHEMEMCGHATVGAVWLLAELGRLPTDHVALSTQSGQVEARVVRTAHGREVEITQPTGVVTALPDDARVEVASVLGVARESLAELPMQNACTSRVKTLVPMKSVAVLDELQPDFSRVEELCERIGSTGLYPYAPSSAGVFDARQFPKSSGYPEDAATGIAAAALAFGLLQNGLVAPSDEPIVVRQGRAMGRASRIVIRFRIAGDEVDGCWLGGRVDRDAIDSPHA